MNDKIKVAAVGAGYFSQFQYQGWRNMDDVRTVALANRSVAKGEALAAQYGVPKVYAHVEEMLDAELPDLLDIITTPATYREYIELAAARGINVICQKPSAAASAKPSN